MIYLPAKPTFLSSIESILLLDFTTVSLGIEHLQIPQKCVARLKDFRVLSIGELIRVSKDFLTGRAQSCGEPGVFHSWDKIERDVKPRILQFAASIRDGKLDWLSFWEEIHYEFTFAAARLNHIFQLDDDTRALSANRLNLGKALSFIEADGIITVGDLFERLAEGLPNYKGFGIKKTRDLGKGLREFIATINSEGTRSFIADSFVPSIASAKYRGRLQYTPKSRDRLSSTAAQLTLGQIHLHNEIEKLANIGVRNLDQLLAIFGKGLPEIRGIGTKARANLLKIAMSADSAISKSGDMDWDLFAEIAGFRTIPSSKVPLTTGTEFLASLGGVVEDLTSQCFDEIETATLVERLIPLKKHTVTLEELGRRFGVTRERIRQKQKTVIERISAAVLENYYEGISFRFTQNFSQFWRAAATYFRGIDSISYIDFMEGLTKVWNVDKHHVIPHLPLIYAILTKNSTLPTVFNETCKLPSNVFDLKHPQDLDKSFNSLHPSKSLSNSISKTGVNSVGQLLDVLRFNSSIMSRHTLDRLTTEILNPLSRALNQQGGIAWQKFYENKGIQCIPDVEIESPDLFVKHAIETVAAFVEHTEITGRAGGIFRLRTVPESADRSTLVEAGNQLGSSGPTIKREENELLERLHDAIFTENYTAAGACFRSSFLKHWKRARKIYRQASNQDRFALLLSAEWELPVTEILKITPMIICIIEGRPKGYTGKRFLTPASIPDFRHTSSEATRSLTVIKLRGFRSIH
jgi:hypothetical protein